MKGHYSSRVVQRDGAARYAGAFRARFSSHGGERKGQRMASGGKERARVALADLSVE